MCFSANASFGAGIVLSVIGVASIKKAEHRSQLLFASIPLIFAVQQISEGVLWLALSNSDAILLQRITTYIFLTFAQIVWPLLVPISILLLEKKDTRRNIQLALVGAGVLLASYLTYCLLTYPVHSKIVEYHIFYQLDYPVKFRIYDKALYVIATIVPAFFSHIKRVWMLGVAILISYIITIIFYEDYFISVWCFFASIISIVVYMIMREIKKSNEKLFTPNVLYLKGI